MVYSSANSAWEEATAFGNFFISTISSSSNTGGGSATPNGTAYRFTISDAPTSAAQLIVCGMYMCVRLMLFVPVVHCLLVMSDSAMN